MAPQSQSWKRRNLLALYLIKKKLNFIAHLEHLKNKCMKALNVIKVVANTKWGADRDTLLRLYQSLIRSKLDYGSIVFGSARPSYLSRLESVANKALRLSLPWSFPHVTNRKSPSRANEPSLGLRREQLSLQYALKLKANPSNSVYTAVFDPKCEHFFSAKPRAMPSFGITVAPVLHSSGLNTPAHLQ